MTSPDTSAAAPSPISTENLTHPEGHVSAEEVVGSPVVVARPADLPMKDWRGWDLCAQAYILATRDEAREAKSTLDTSRAETAAFRGKLAETIGKLMLAEKVAAAANARADAAMQAQAETAMAFNAKQEQLAEAINEANFLKAKLAKRGPAPAPPMSAELKAVISLPDGVKFRAVDIGGGKRAHNAALYAVRAGYARKVSRGVFQRLAEIEGPSP